MPELPEVETVCRNLNQITLNQTIQGGEVLLQRTLAHPIYVAEFWQGVTGLAIAQWQRRGKYLLGQLVDAEQQLQGWLGVHLRMTGQLLWSPHDKPLPAHTRIRLQFDSGQELRFVDTRTFGRWWWVPSGVEPSAIITGLQKLGPEPFEPAFSISYLTAKLARSRRAIKTALLDQALVAGIGNIYADEVLFQSGISPLAITAELTPEQVTRLHETIPLVLNAAIEKGGTTFSDFLNLLGVDGNYGEVAWVYGRGGEPCKVCGTAIARIKLNGRSAHYCPQCQML